MNAVLKKTTSAPIRNSFTYNGYGAVIKSTGKIDRWPLVFDANFDTGVGTAVSGATYATDYGDIGGVANVYCPILQDAGYLYVGSGNIVYRVDLSVAGYP